MSLTHKVYCDPLGGYVELSQRPQRVVSLASGLTETLVYMGYARTIVGVSEYCHRYVPELQAPSVGNYLQVDEATLRALAPDLVLITTGVQRKLARRLYEQGFPVYAIPLPNSLYGVLENVILLGALMDDMPAARALVECWNRTFIELSAAASASRRRVYAELWFGKHARMTGGLTFVHDLIEAAGGENIFRDVRQGYLSLDLDEVVRRCPDVFVCFSEPEYPIQGLDLARERGWEYPIIQADVSPDHNLIHDGPSMMRAVRWLHQSLRAL